MEVPKTFVDTFVKKFIVGAQMTRQSLGVIQLSKKLLAAICALLRLQDDKIKRLKVIIILPLIILSLTAGCGENSQAKPAQVKEAAQVASSITIQVNGRNFSATLEDNSTVRAFTERLPLEANMKELNGNEKYFYLDGDLPSDSQRVGQVHSGDLMLFGSNCVVLFY